MFSPFLLTYYFRIFLFAKTHKPLSKILTPLEKSLRKIFDLSSLKTIESFSSPFLGLVSSTTSYRLFFPLNCFFFLDIMKYALSLSVLLYCLTCFYFFLFKYRLLQMLYKIIIYVFVLSYFLLLPRSLLLLLVHMLLQSILFILFYLAFTKTQKISSF